MEGTKLFNDSVKEGLRYFEQHHFLSASPTPEEMAIFLSKTPNLDKKVVGELLAKPDNGAILQCYMNQFNFTGVRKKNMVR
jgi:brefeldin A-resistance guanine nucleotide exchange factor 1